MFSFPLDNPSLLEKWKNAIPSENLIPAEHNGVRELHFKPDDIVRETQDTNERRRTKKNADELKLVRPKDDAIPSLFPNCSSYLLKHLPPRRSGSATREMRVKKVNGAAKEQQRLESERDKVTSLIILLSKLNRNLLPRDILDTKIGDEHMFYSLAFENKPLISYCVLLKQDLSFGVFQGDIEISASKFRDITKSLQISKCSQLVQLITRVKAISNSVDR